MNDYKFTIREILKGHKLVAKTYLEYKKLALEQLEKEGLPEDDVDDVIEGLLITKILVLEGKLEEKYWLSAIS